MTAIHFLIANRKIVRKKGEVNFSDIFGYQFKYFHVVLKSGENYQ